MARSTNSDHEYNEAEDDDYNPAAAESDVASTSDDEPESTAKDAQKRKADVEAADLDSGDEATIKHRQLHKRRKVEFDQGVDNDSFVRTRAQRLHEKIEAKNRKRAAGGRITIDVDSVWAELKDLPIGARPKLDRLDLGDGEEDMENEQHSSDATITIKRKIKFAGAVTEVEEEVARDSAEAQAWLAEQAQEKEQDRVDAQTSQAEDNKLRPLRRISKFEPNPLGIVKGVPVDKLRRKTPSRVDLVMAERREEEERAKKAEKLSTMQKTQLDWKGFVAEQGLGEELKEYGKSKKGFIAREAFLDKVAGANESARRTARLKG